MVMLNDLLWPSHTSLMFSQEDDAPKETMLAAISCMRKGGVKNAKETYAHLEDDGDGNTKPQR